MSYKHPCVCAFTSRRPLLCADPAQDPRVAQVGGHSVTASDRRSLHWHHSASHELGPGHTVAVATLCWVDWEKTETSRASAQRTNADQTQRHNMITGCWLTPNPNPLNPARS